VPNLVDDREELRPDEQQLGTGVVDDVRDFGRREPPVDWDENLLRLGSPKPDLVERVGVFLNHGNASLHGVTHCEQTVGDASRARVQLLVARRRGLKTERGAFRPGGRTLADQLREVDRKPGRRCEQSP
jgi:hypothetical protein